MLCGIVQIRIECQFVQVGIEYCQFSRTASVQRLVRCVASCVLLERWGFLARQKIHHLEIPMRFVAMQAMTLEAVHSIEMRRG